jgi:hypothetical protein
MREHGTSKNAFDDSKISKDNHVLVGVPVDISRNTSHVVTRSQIRNQNKTVATASNATNKNNKTSTITNTSTYNSDKKNIIITCSLAQQEKDASHYIHWVDV